MKNEEQVGADSLHWWLNSSLYSLFIGNHHLPMLYRSNALQVKAPKAKQSLPLRVALYLL